MCNDDDKELFFLFIAKHSFRGGGVIEVFEYIKKSMEIKLIGHQIIGTMWNFCKL